jgi:hypothetical protein
MISAQELYGRLWVEDSGLDEELARSLEPRAHQTLFDAFAALEPRPDDGDLWGIYQLLGKLRPTVHVLERPHG